MKSAASTELQSQQDRYRGFTDAMSCQLPDLEQYIERVVIDVEDPRDADKARETFVGYARAITTDSELQLDPRADTLINAAQQSVISAKASFLCGFDIVFSKPAVVGAAGDEIPFGIGDIDGQLGPGARRSQKARLRRYVQEARADGRITPEEVVDFLVLKDQILDDKAEGRPSSLNGARLLLQRWGIPVTELRLQSMARRTDAAAASYGDEA